MTLEERDEMLEQLFDDIVCDKISEEDAVAKYISAGMCRDNAVKCYFHILSERGKAELGWS